MSETAWWKDRLRALEAERDRLTVQVSLDASAIAEAWDAAEKAEANAAGEYRLRMSWQQTAEKAEAELAAVSQESLAWQSHLVQFHSCTHVVEVKRAAGREDCPHLDWGQDESGEGYCHDCKRIVPMSEVPSRLPPAAKSAARFQDELREAIEREARDG
jgi:hypothetical protein